MPDGAMILKEAMEAREFVTALYRRFHQWPEVAGEEVETNRTIRRTLEEMDIQYLSPAPNITIALLEGAASGATVGLRCDTDALPVQEDTGLPYASQRPGVMHACGHDGHTAIGLGVAKLLRALRSEWRGRVKIIFQPSEEVGKGALETLRTGLLRDVDVFFAIHLWSAYPSGLLCVSPIVVSAAVDGLRMEIVGKGGHGATPEKCHDALLAACAVVNALQAAVSRMISPVNPAVLTIGSFHAGTAGNVIAPKAELKGTLRSVDEETRANMIRAIRQISEHTAQAYGCEARVEIIPHHGEVRNDPRAAELALACAQSLPGMRVASQRTMMLGDDFACYAAQAPGCYAQVGIADASKGTDAAHHSGRFQIDEAVLPMSVAWMASFAMAAGEKWKQ